MSIQASSSGGKKCAAVLLCRTTRTLQELHGEVAPRASCSSWATGMLASVCVRQAQYARWRGSPWCISSFCLRVAGGVLGRGNHASAWSDILVCPRPGKVDACATEGEGKSEPITGNTRWAIPSARSAQINGAVRVHQESLIR
jgi:hypothetical protein